MALLIPNHARGGTDRTRIDKRNRTALESKQEIAKREASPDDADALVLTFAERVEPQIVVPTPMRSYGRTNGWDK